MVFIKKMIAAVIRVTALVLGLIKSIDTSRLWSVTWRLSSDPMDGASLLAHINRHQGSQAARAAADEIIERSKSCLPVMVMAGIEFYECRDIEAAYRLVKAARDAGYDKQEELLSIEFLLSDFIEEYDERDVMERILARNDLSMDITQWALNSKAVLLLKDQLFEQAEQIADRVLSIVDDPIANIVKWTLCVARSQEDSGAGYLERAKKKLGPARANFLMAECCLCIGRKQEAMEILYRIGEKDSIVFKSKSVLAELSRSEEFRKFCADRSER